MFQCLHDLLVTVLPYIYVVDFTFYIVFCVLLGIS